MIAMLLMLAVSTALVGIWLAFSGYDGGKCLTGFDYWTNFAEKILNITTPAAAVVWLTIKFAGPENF